jgi:hypothetical protein
VAEHQLRRTPSADRAIQALRGRSAKDWERLEPELKSHGCRSAGYRLLAADEGWSHYCCKHLSGRWRVVTTFEPGIVLIIAVGEHDGPAFYKHLADNLEISSAGRQREEKPPCCGPDGWPSMPNASST